MYIVYTSNSGNFAKNIVYRSTFKQFQFAFFLYSNLYNYEINVGSTKSYYVSDKTDSAKIFNYYMTDFFISFSFSVFVILWPLLLLSNFPSFVLGSVN